MTRVCMVVFSHYPADPRVRRAAEALAQEGASVDVICLTGPGQARRETVRGVRVFRLPVQRRRAGRLRYVWEYGCFLLLAFLKVSWLHLARRYRLVHVHNMPDVLVLSALLPRLTGAKLILDLHDPMPEVCMAKYGLAADHPVVRLLRMLERLSIRLAHRVLTPNLSFRRLFISRGCPAGKIHIVMNAPQESVFRPPPPAADQGAPSGRAGRQVLMYHGTIVERHGLDTALEALALLRRDMPGLCFQVYGDGDFVEGFRRRVAELGLDGAVAYHGFVSLERIAEEIRHIDVGVIPNKRSVFTEINLPTRIFEYLAMGKLVVAPRTRGVLDYFGEDSLFMFEPGNAGSLAEALRRALDGPQRSQAVLQRGLCVYRRHRWQIERRRLLTTVRLLLEGGPA